MRIILSMVVVSVIALATLGAAQSEEADREAELRAAVNAFGRAFLEADVPTLGSLLSQNYIHVNGGSGNVLSREDWLKWVKSRKTEIENGELVVKDYRIEDVRIVIDDNTAVVVGVVSSSQVRNGNSSTIRVRFSNTWLYQNARWRRAAFHDSPLP